MPFTHLLKMTSYTTQKQHFFFSSVWVEGTYFAEYRKLLREILLLSCMYMNFYLSLEILNLVIMFIFLKIWKLLCNWNNIILEYFYFVFAYVFLLLSLYLLVFFSSWLHFVPWDSKYWCDSIEPLEASSSK